jgi:hypothetical protein
MTYLNDKLCPIGMAAGMDFQMLQITLVCTVYSCVQRLGGASFATYELLLEKLTQQD